MAKKRHHYVPQGYLKAWAENNQVWVLRDNNIYQANIRDVCNQRYLHKLAPITGNQISFIENFLKLSKENTRSDTILGAIDLINSIIKLCKGLDFSPIFISFLEKTFPEAAAHQDIVSSKEKLERMVEHWKSSLYEDYFSLFEEEHLRVLDKVRMETQNFFSWDDYEFLCNFMALQLCRSLKKIKIQRNALESLLRKNGEKFGVTNVSNDDISNIILLLLPWFFSEFSNGILAKNINVTIIQNNTSCEFVTSDDPSFNHLYKQGRNDFEVLLPISPKILIKYSLPNYSKEELDINKQKITNIQGSNENMLGFLVHYEEMNSELNVISQNIRMNDNKYQLLIASNREYLEQFCDNND